VPAQSYPAEPGRPAYCGGSHQPATPCAAPGAAGFPPARPCRPACAADLPDASGGRSLRRRHGPRPGAAPPPAGGPAVPQAACATLPRAHGWFPGALPECASALVISHTGFANVPKPSGLTGAGTSGFAHAVATDGPGPGCGGPADGTPPTGGAIGPFALTKPPAGPHCYPSQTWLPANGNGLL